MISDTAMQLPSAAFVYAAGIYKLSGEWRIDTYPAAQAHVESDQPA
jgi:hypothetical protein